MKQKGGCWLLGGWRQHIFNYLWEFFLEIPDEKFNVGYWSYLFKIWTQEQVRDLTTEKLIEEHLGLFQIKQHYERQNLDPPAEFLADLELLMKKLRTDLDLSKSF